MKYFSGTRPLRNSGVQLHRSKRQSHIFYFKSISTESIFWFSHFKRTAYNVKHGRAWMILFLIVASFECLQWRERASFTCEDARAGNLFKVQYLKQICLYIYAKKNANIRYQKIYKVHVYWPTALCRIQINRIIRRLHTIDITYLDRTQLIFDLYWVCLYFWTTCKFRLLYILQKSNQIRKTSCTDRFLLLHIFLSGVCYCCWV